MLRTRTTPSVLMISFPVFILWLALFLRIHQLLNFPPFIDEAHHILWASDVYTLHPFTGASNGKLFGLWWMAGFGMVGDGALWLARAATALFSLIGIAALYSAGRLLVSPLVGLTAALAYSLAPLGLFFDRMALVDPYVAVFGSLTVAFSIRMTRSTRRSDAVLAGLALVGAMLAKATGIMLLVVPALGLLLLVPAHRWRRHLASLLLCYGVFAALWGPFYLFLCWRGYDYFSTATSVVGTSSAFDGLDRLLPNLRAVLRIDILYLGAPLLWLVAGAAAYLLVRRPRTGAFLLLTTLIPLSALLIFATRLSTRYVHFHVPLLLLLVFAGVGLLAQDIARKTRLPRAVLPLGLLTLWAVMVALPFASQYANDPKALALPDYDRIEYFAGDSAGFALPEVAQRVMAASAEVDQPGHVVGLFSNCEGLRRILPASGGVTVECPVVALDGSRQSQIAARVDAACSELGATMLFWVVVETDSPYFSLEGIQTPLETVDVVVRPDGVTRLTVYRSVP